jgi:hypothetical protein
VFVTAFCVAVMALCVDCVVEVLELDAVGATKLRSDERLELLEFDEFEELEEPENNEASVLFTTLFAFSTSCAAWFEVEDDDVDVALVLEELDNPANDENIEEDELDEFCDNPENNSSIVLVISLLITCSSCWAWALVIWPNAL